MKFGFARAASRPEKGLQALLQSPLNDPQLVENLQAEWQASGAIPALADLGLHNPLPRLSWLFDAEYYLERNADVAQAGFDPYMHFLHHGLAEQRDPHPLIDLAYVLQQLDLPGPLSAERLAQALRTNSIEPHPAFDTTYYLQQNPDVAAAGLPPLEHYLRHGADEGRAPHPDFQPKPPSQGAEGANVKAFVTSARGVQAPAADRPRAPSAKTPGGDAPATSQQRAAKGSGSRGFQVGALHRVARNMARKLLRRMVQAMRSESARSTVSGHASPGGGTQAALAPRRITGAFDDVSGHVAHGWVFAPDEPERRLVVEIVDGNAIVGRATADIHRADLERAGIGDGRYGFSIPLMRALLDGQSHQLAARVDGGVPLPFGDGKTFQFERCALSYDILPDQALAAHFPSLPAVDQERFRQAMQDVNMLLATGQFEGALGALSALAEAFGEGPLLWLKTGEAHLVGKRADRSIESFDRVLESSDALAAWAWLGRGNAQTALGQWHEARRCYERANECEPDLAPVMARLAKVDHHDNLLEVRRLLGCGDSNAALRRIGLLLLSHPDDPKVHSLAMEALDARAGGQDLAGLDSQAAAAGRQIRLLTLSLAALDREAHH